MHGAKSLERKQSFCWSRNFQPLMKRQGSVPCLHEPVSGVHSNNPSNSEGLFNIPYPSSFSQKVSLSLVILPFWRTTSCRLSTTAYSMYFPVKSMFQNHLFHPSLAMVTENPINMRKVWIVQNIICTIFYVFVGKGKENYKQRAKQQYRR
jgi:hypothetical protein